MGTKLSYWHEISEKRNYGKENINQRLEMMVDYNPCEDSIDTVLVFIYEDGKCLAEISKLLDKAEGSPLAEMIEAINWRELYADSKEEVIHD